MKFDLWLFLGLIVLSGCGNNSSSGSSSLNSAPSSSLSTGTKQVQTVPEVQDFLAEMNEYIIVYLKGTAIDNVIFEYTDSDSGPLEAPARGYCDKSGFTPKIVLYRADWIGPYAAGSTMKKAAFYHLMGHCVFNKAHNDEVYYSGMDGRLSGAKSFMHSNFGYHLFPPSYGGGTTRLNPEKMVGLQREFFNYYGPL